MCPNRYIEGEADEPMHRSAVQAARTSPLAINKRRYWGEQIIDQRKPGDDHPITGSKNRLERSRHLAANPLLGPDKQTCHRRAEMDI